MICAVRCRCLNMSQSFPPGRFIWCNEGRNGGPTARPIARRGGHACCNDRDFCNRDLQPLIKRSKPTRLDPSHIEFEDGRQSVTVEGACGLLHVFRSSKKKSPSLTLTPTNHKPSVCSLARRSKQIKQKSCPVWSFLGLLSTQFCPLSWSFLRWS